MTKRKLKKKETYKTKKWKRRTQQWLHHNDNPLRVKNKWIKEKKKNPQFLQKGEV